MRLLIYGAGVIGSLYAVLVDDAGYDTTIYARRKRLESLRKDGLRYQKGNKILKKNVKVLDHLEDDDRFDYIFLTVRGDQVHQALKELKSNESPTIVTMVNSIENYQSWENLCGAGRILPAFPGAGGDFKEEVLDAALTPRMVQPTTFGEIDGRKSQRVIALKDIFRKSKIPYQIVKDMHTWQLCHLAMVVPIADAYAEVEDPARTGYNQELMIKTALRLKRNFITLYRNSIVLSPQKMHLLRFIPKHLLAFFLRFVYQSSFGQKFMYGHVQKAPEEIRQLHTQFYSYMIYLDKAKA